MGSQRSRDSHGKAVNFGFDKADRAVTCHYYFSVLDPDLGPGVDQAVQLLPRPGHGVAQRHQWAKRQAATAGLAVTEPANGVAARELPERLQALCDRPGPDQASSTAGCPCPRPR